MLVRNASLDRIIKANRLQDRLAEIMCDSPMSNDRTFDRLQPRYYRLMEYVRQCRKHMQLDHLERELKQLQEA